MHLYNNFLDQNYSERIEQLILSPNFSWYYTKSTNYDDKSEDGYFIDDKTIETPQFIHTVYKEIITSEIYYELLPLLSYYNIDYNNLIRCKINLLCKNYSYPKDCYHTPHQDANKDHKSLLYYVNNSDGDTVFFDKKHGEVVERVTPRKGSAILFDSSVYHASTPPNSNNSRCVINCIFVDKS